MRIPLQSSITLVAAALASSVALAQQPSMQSPIAPKATTANPGTGVGGSGSFSGWLSDYQTKNQGRVSRQAYMDEVGRRWDATDANKQGLTQDQINQTYGYGTGSGPAGTSTAPGNMGPNNVKK